MEGEPNPAIAQHDAIMRAIRGEKTDDSLFAAVSSPVDDEE
jgi:hypothetical protein